MRLLSAYLSYRALNRSQWLDPEAIRMIQWRKLKRLLDHAYQTVPFYRQHFEAAGLTPAGIRCVEDLSKLPAVTKRDLIEAGPDAIVSAAFDRSTLREEKTTGSSGEPFTMWFDQRYLAFRRTLFLRGLRSMGWRPGRRMMMISSGTKKRPFKPLRWHYVAFDSSPEVFVDGLNRIRPHVLYGWVSPLRQLAQHVVDTGARVHRPASIVTTAEPLDDATRDLFVRAFDAEVYQLYGSTEMGLVAWECSMHEGLHFAEDAAIVEFAPPAPGSSERKLILTNLELYGTPFIRYETADLAAPLDASGPCGCGRTLMRMSRVEGRLVDAIRLRAGGMISPYKFTCAIEEVAGVVRYQIVQEDYERFVVRVESQRSDLNGLGDGIRSAVRQLVHDRVEVEVECRESLEPRPGQKFRVVESRVGRSDADRLTAPQQDMESA